MKPFKQTPTLTESQLHFNRALGQARVVIEQAFGILKGRWRCLYKNKQSPHRYHGLLCPSQYFIDVGDPNAIDPVEDDDEMDQSSFNGDGRLCSRNIRDDIMIHLS